MSGFQLGGMDEVIGLHVNKCVRYVVRLVSGMAWLHEEASLFKFHASQGVGDNPLHHLSRVRVV